MSNAVSFLKYGDVAEFRNGLNFSKDSHGKGCKFIGVADFKDNFTPQWKLLGEINPFGVAKREDYLEPGDIIFVRSNGNKALVGRSLYIDLNEKSLYSGFCIRARLKTDDFLPLFLAYYTRTNFFKSAITSVAGTNINNLNQDILGNIMIPHYSIGIQKSIVAVLTSIDEKIAINNRINAELEAMAKTLYDYWFVQFDFPDANGKPYKTSGGRMEYNATLKREIPAGWAVNTLSQIANITMGQSPAGESYNEDGIGTLFFQGSTDFGWLFPTPRQYTTSPTRMAKKGDILLSVRAPVGDMNIANADCCIGRGLAALNSKSRSDGFLFYVMKYFKQVFERRNAEGTTFGSMTKDDLHSLQVVCPEPGLLKRYDDIVSEYNKMIFTRSLENQDLIKLRDWLLPILMNGQVKIK
ncbi:restriction endonuclease subunit S [Escherichia coli]|jgi:type I restriction enzyme S subunit|uniref:Restriction endonuclease subunit S n=11 Tax=Escherichia coli TaxID=562 RepID=A0A0C2GWE9_ECOLX|nr:MULTISPECIES: restriction endonuclease subunit S [Enterobacteriaceae]EBO3012093.1 restriction endonuclease subunit S [Salmonella enterica subsp. enterica serovar Newport]EEZ5680920.1 restriction endonuclease subunit S [Escherichia coli O25]EEZ5971222.1 restriction endonuclease subunit S [Escherichia coli O2]EEZ9845438.1 restriction endonuclease subunit S [Escherichia coli O119]EFA4204140.1 restriction endonuclease subunit S [Escherichia coli O2:H32]EFA8246199.1 restriction endonuclease sub